MKKLLTSAILALGAFAVHAATLSPVQLLNPAGSASGQAIVSTGASTPPVWGNVPAAGLAAQAANTMLANATASSASPTAVAVPSCSTANSALKYTSGTGLSCGTTFALTSGTLNQFASTTSAQLAGIVSDESGSGSLIFGTSPTIGTATINTPTISGGTINNATVGATTPAAGKFTTLQATSTITPSSTAGIVGTTTNDSAQAGSVGEYATNTTSSVSLTSGTPANITSVSLTAGDWDVTGGITFQPAASTTVAQIIAGCSSTSATFPAGAGTIQSVTATLNTGSNQNLSAPIQRLSLSATTTVYLVGQSTFSVSTMTATGMIRARRVR